MPETSTLTIEDLRHVLTDSVCDEPCDLDADTVAIPVEVES